MADDAPLRDALVGGDGTADPVIPVRPDQIFADPTAAGPLVGTPAVPVPSLGFALPRVAIGEEALIEAERQLEAERERARQATETERQDRNRAESQQRTARRATAGGYAVPSVTGGTFIRPPLPVRPGAARPTDLSRLPPPTTAQWTRPQGPGSAPQGFTPPSTGPTAPWQQSGNSQAQRVQQVMQQWSAQAAARRSSGSTSSRKKSGSAIGCLVFIVFAFVIFGQAGEGLINLIKSFFDGR